MKTLTRLAILSGIGFLVYQNRFRIQQMLEANGISTPWMNRDLGEAVNSGISKVSGKVEHAFKRDQNLVTDRDSVVRSA